ncbi:rho GTPase-activating protein 5-like isoform X6 [Antedon mediterranea]|uniref:rho GTPase-activating protein 5-like isoform X6 n=1 Tax=Antedon mediterranea TaxID=105859 RepID=UPI003AF726A5
MAGKQKDKERVFNISVVGLSGTDKEKGSCGVGKSCLCNRFVRPEADDYYKEHICVISQSDFSGRVVNNDHFVYWGEKKLVYEGQTYSFRIIEQTDFIDDSSFQPFRGNNTRTYLNRCVSTKIGSQDKLMYLCKDQLGDEDNFKKVTFTNGKISIDGFLIVYDASLVRQRNAEKQIEFMASLHSLLKKTGKSYVIAVTKCDEADDYNMHEIEKFAQKHKILLIETSANEAVNVNLAFVTLVQLIDKSKGTRKVVPYSEANKHRKITIDRVTDSYSAILKEHITNYHLKWNSMKRFEHEPAYEDYIFHLGTRQAKKRFDSHVKKLKTNHQQHMLEQYLHLLPSVFDDIFPDLNIIGQRSWSECRESLEKHERFEKWFIHLDGEWQEHPHINQTLDNRIPASIFTTHDSDCESQFKNHINKLCAAKRKERMQSDFRKLLQASSHEVMPGKRYEDITKHFKEEESFQELTVDERKEIYNSHQEEITQKAKNDFKELLFECAEVFTNFDKLKLSHEHLLAIQDSLQSYPRYGALEFLWNDRHALLIKHLAFIQHPTPETCISGMHCMDLLIKAHINKHLLRTTAPSLLQTCEDEFKKLNILILGQDGLAEELSAVIESQCCDGEYTLDGTLHNLQLRAIEGDVSQSQNAFKTEEFTPAGCICTFSGRESFEYIKSSLESTILNPEYDNKDLYKLPIIFVFARGVLVEDDEHNEIKEEAQTMSKRLSSTEFVDMPRDESMLMRGNKFHEKQIQQAIRAILTSTQPPNPHDEINGHCLMETLTIGLCVMCGDEHTVENILSPFVKNDLCYRTPQTDYIFNVVTYIDDKKANVEIRASSYHAAAKYAAQCNGLILFYSPKRKGSYETMKNFASKHDDLAIKIVAVCDGEKAVQHFELTRTGEDFASKIDAGFMITGTDFGAQTEAFTPFFHEVMMHKNDSEDSDTGSEPEIDIMQNRPPLPTPGDSDGRKNLGSIEENSTVTPQESDSDVIEGKDDVFEKDDEEKKTRKFKFLLDREPNKSHSDFMERLRKWEADPSDLENLYPNRQARNETRTPENIYATVTKPKKLWSPFSRNDEPCEPVYAVVEPTIYDDPHVCYPPPSSEERIYCEVGEGIFHHDQNRADHQRPMPKHVPPPMKPTRIFSDQGLNPNQFEDDYKEEENPIYIAASTTKLPPPPVKPKPIRSKNQPKKLDLDKFSAVKQAVGNNRSVRTPSQKGGSNPLGDIATSEGYAVPHDVLQLPLDSGNVIYDEPVDTLHRSKPRKYSSNKTPTVSESRTSSGKKKTPPTPLSPQNGSFLMELQKTKTFTQGTKELEEREGGAPMKRDREINDENLYDVVSIESNDEKESSKQKKDQKKKRGKPKDQDKPKRQKQEDNKSKKKRKKNGKSVIPPQPPQVKRPPIEECVTGDETVPQFVIKCVEFLEEEGINQEGIYRIPGKGADSDFIMATFGKNPDMKLADMHMSVPAVCTALKQFFSKLPEPLIPYDLQQEFLDSCQDAQNQEEQTQAIHDLLDKMPRIKKETLKYMMFHLNRVMMNFLRNKMNSQNLAICWLITLMHTNCKTVLEMQKIPRLTPILEILISEPLVFFPDPVVPDETLTRLTENGDTTNDSELNVEEMSGDEHSIRNTSANNDITGNEDIRRTEVVTM